MEQEYNANVTKVVLENSFAVLTLWPQCTPVKYPDHRYHDQHHLHQHQHAPPSSPRFSFVSKSNTGLGIFDASTVEFRGKVRNKAWKATMAQALNVQVVETDLGKGEGALVAGLADFRPKALTLTAELPEVGQVFVDFALSNSGPALIVRLRCPSIVCSEDLRLDEFVLFDGDGEVSEGPRRDGKSFIRLCWDYIARRVRGGGPRRVFVNGWNAWSFSGAIQQGERPSTPGLPGIFCAAFHHGAGPAEFDRSNNKELYSEMFALLSDKSRGTGLLLGFLTQHEQFGAFSFDERFVEVGAHCRCDGQLLKPGTFLQSDWCMLELQPILPEEPLAAFMARSAQVNAAMLPQQHGIDACVVDTTRVPVGWCSWYHFYEAISEDNLLANLGMMAKLQPQLPLELFQIDDGYQQAWGDWLALDSLKFPTKSMRDLVMAVRAQGLRPGLWLAPVAVDKHSRVAAEHPEWIIRRQGGLSDGWASNSANCGKWFYGLDVTVPEVQTFIRETLTTVSHGDWSFDYLKLDFLYAAALKGVRQDPTLNTAQVLQLALRLIREAVGPSTYVLGCGSPLGATIGWVNANRVSADAGPAWLPTFPLPDCKWNLPCGRNMVRNTINRLPMHGIWWVNDPDCMLLRESTQFTPSEVVGIATVKALSGGSFLVSDDLESVSRSRMRIAQAMLPVTGRAAVALDMLEREMPEVLRLHMEKRGEEQEGSSAGRLDGLPFPHHREQQSPWVLIGLCNWGDSKKEVTYPWKALLRPLLSGATGSSSSSSSSNDGVVGGAMGPLTLHVLEFWTSEYFRVRLDLNATPDAVMSASALSTIGGGVLPHSARLYAVRIDERGEHAACSSQEQQQLLQLPPMYLGSDVHFTCGWELRCLDWGELLSKRKEEKGTRVIVRVTLDAGKQVDGGLHHIWLDLPGSEDTTVLEGAPEGSEKVQGSVQGSPHGLHLPHMPRVRSHTEEPLSIYSITSLGHIRTVWKIRFPEGNAQTVTWTLSYVVRKRAK
ncbi:hypothetical protein VYU27_003175 [Nannochloropsis oceanica]